MGYVVSAIVAISLALLFFRELIPLFVFKAALVVIFLWSLFVVLEQFGLASIAAE